MTIKAHQNPKKITIEANSELRLIPQCLACSVKPKAQPGTTKAPGLIVPSQTQVR